MKNIVITGSTSGIGKELVKLFSKDSEYKIFAGYRNESLKENIDNVEYFYIEMSNKQSIIDAANLLKEKIDKIDILINVAGAVVAGPIETITTDRLREQFEVNTFSHIEFVQNLLPILDNGRIINVSSMASFGHFPFISPYCASKRALDIFFNALSLETHRNIKVVSIKPGVIATPIWSKSVEANSNELENCKDYSLEMKFLKENALKNSNRGLKVDAVAKFIKRVANMKSPKSTYTIGLDAKFAHLISLLPQDLINRIIKFGMLIKFNKVR